MIISNVFRLKNLSRSLLALLTVAMLAVGASACGSTRKALTQTSVSPDRDPDYGPDKDDQLIRGLGHSATASERREIKGLVKRYYAAAVAGNASRVCSMVYTTSLARINFPETLVLELIATDYLRGRSCVPLVSPLLRSAHIRLSDELATARITRIRVAAPNGFVLLSFRGMPERVIPVERVRGRWKVATLLPSVIA